MKVIISQVLDWTNPTFDGFLPVQLSSGTSLESVPDVAKSRSESPAFQLVEVFVLIISVFMDINGLKAGLDKFSEVS